MSDFEETKIYHYINITEIHESKNEKMVEVPPTRKVTAGD